MITAGKDMNISSTAQFFTANITTALLSCFNPIVFVLFTPTLKIDFQSFKIGSTAWINFTSTLPFYLECWFDFKMIYRISRLLVQL